MAISQTAEKDLKEQRLRHIVEMMATPGGWRTGISNKALADEWGLHVNTVDRYAAEASRYIMASLGDPEELRARIIGQLEALTALAVEKGTYLRDAIQAMDLKAELLGLKRPKHADDGVRKVDVTISRYQEPEALADDGDPEA